MPNTPSDTTYNLVSVLYHALQGSETAEKYRQDAEEQGATQMAAFFEQVGEQQRELGLRARRLLKEALQNEEQGERQGARERPAVPLDDNARVGEASRESFPASDPPAY